MNARATSTLAHDLRGPVVTIEGFQGEIGTALDSLEAMLSDDAIALPEAAVARIADLLSDDLRPCLSFASRAVTTLHERIDELDAANADPKQAGTDELGEAAGE